MRFSSAYPAPEGAWVRSVIAQTCPSALRAEIDRMQMQPAIAGEFGAVQSA